RMSSAAADDSGLHDDLGFDRVRLSDSSSSLRELLDSCSKSLEAEDFLQSEAAVRDLADFVDSVWSSARSNPEDEISKRIAFDVLSEIRRFVVSSASNQVRRLFGFLDLEKQYFGVSEICSSEWMVVLADWGDFGVVGSGTVTRIQIVEFSAACKSYEMDAVNDSLSFVLPKVVVKFAGLSPEYCKVADSIVDHFVSACNPRDMLAILCEALDSLPQVLKTPACYVPLLSGLSKVILSIRRRQFEQIKVAVPVVLVSLKSLSGESDSEDKSSLRDLYNRAINIANSIQTICEKLNGAALAVIWASISDDIGKVAGEDLANVKSILHCDQNKRWQAVGMLRHVLSSIDQSWEFKSHAIDFLLSILDGNISEECNENPVDCISDITNLFTALQAVERVIMHASDAVLRKKAFTSLKGIALLIDIVREEIRKEDRKMSSIEDGVVKVNNKSHPSSPFWSSDTLDLVELILKPPNGGPPFLPENSDAVMSALNLYRYLLIRESTGKTNHTGVLSESNLRKAYGEWLLPLRTLVSGFEAENQKDSRKFAVDAVCALNPIQLVLYRCIELVEENLRHFK
ncbi:hypothetical protein ACLOJK_002533, partial [Asimina triloba]